MAKFVPNDEFLHRRKRDTENTDEAEPGHDHVNEQIRKNLTEEEKEGIVPLEISNKNKRHLVRRFMQSYMVQRDYHNYNRQNPYRFIPMEEFECDRYDHVLEQCKEISKTHTPLKERIDYMAQLCAVHQMCYACAIRGDKETPKESDAYAIETARECDEYFAGEGHAICNWEVIDNEECADKMREFVEASRNVTLVTFCESCISTAYQRILLRARLGKFYDVKK